MIEIALDETNSDSFLDKKRAVFEYNQTIGTDLRDYYLPAKELLQNFAQEEIVIFKTSNPDFSNNLFALALFVQSYFIEHQIECVVFKVSDSKIATKAYKPYVALSIAIKYALRLQEETPAEAYRELVDMGYLGIEVTEDFEQHTIEHKLNKAGALQQYQAKNLSQALVWAGRLKALSLIDAPINICVKMDKKQTDKPLSLEETAYEIWSFVKNYI